MCQEATYAPQQTAPLFDHLVGAGEQRWRHGEAERPGGLGIDDQFELTRLHDRQVRGLRALEDTIDIGVELPSRDDELCNIFTTLAWRSAHLTATAPILSRCGIVLTPASSFKVVGYGGADDLRKSVVAVRSCPLPADCDTLRKLSPAEVSEHLIRPLATHL
jgi:hypothetical protein